MGFAVFVHRRDSRYEDTPAQQYQFPKQYLSRVSAAVGDWIVYYEPTKVLNSKGYFAVAKVGAVVPDPTNDGMYLALIEPQSYLDFSERVPFTDHDGYVERGLLNTEGRLSGWAQAAVRPLSSADFNRIISRGLDDSHQLLPRVGSITPDVSRDELDEEQTPFVTEVERVRVELLSSRIIRDRVFRKVVLRAYDERCAVTGLRLINGGGRAEVDAAHIRPVEFGGPDTVSNGMALSGTAHWMFDRGLIGVADDYSIIVSRHVNDRDAVEGLINRSGILVGPANAQDRPHPAFLRWHRDNCFKH